MRLIGAIYFSLTILLQISCSHHESEYLNDNRSNSKNGERNIIKNSSENISELIQNENLVELERIFSQSQNVNSPLLNGKTPLIEAIFWNKKSVVILFLNLKADPLLKDEHGLTAIDHAQNKKNLLVLLKPELLAEIQQRLYDSILSKDTDALKILLEESIELNFHFPDGSTPLILAIKNKFDSIVRLFLQPGAIIDIEFADTEKITPLMWAEKVDAKRIIKMLKSYRKD